MHDINGLSLEDFGLTLSDNNERSGKLRINQPASSNQQASALSSSVQSRPRVESITSLPYDVVLQSIHIKEKTSQALFINVCMLTSTILCL